MMPSMIEHEASWSTEKGIATPSQKPCALTYDESKAAEAAFRGQPFNPSWSASTRKIYEGILAAMGKREMAAIGEPAVETECTVR